MFVFSYALSCWQNSEKGVLPVNLAAQTLAVDFRCAGMLLLERRLERLQCTCESGETYGSGCQRDG